jgi:hypothetical protein
MNHQSQRQENTNAKKNSRNVQVKKNKGFVKTTKTLEVQQAIKDKFPELAPLEKAMKRCCSRDKAGPFTCHLMPHSKRALEPHPMRR